MLKNNLLWKHGTYIVGFLALAGVIAYIIFSPLLIVIVPFFIFCLFFFRNPARVCPQAQNDSQIIICPADGKIVDIVHKNEQDLDGYEWKVSIFLSPLDVHVNWLPVSGIVEEIAYRPGKFVVAYAPKSSDINERNDLVVRNEQGTFMIRQIAGIIARRICCWVKPGDFLKAGNTFGMIRFGSRVELFLPESIALSVSRGERVYGGKTVLGRFTSR